MINNLNYISTFCIISSYKIINIKSSNNYSYNEIDFILLFLISFVILCRITKKKN